MSNFSKRLRQLRLENKITLEKMAEDLHTTKASLSRYENSKREPKYEVVNMFSDYFNVSVDYLLGKTDSREIVILNKNVDGYEAVIHMAKDADVKPDVLENFIRFLVQQQGNKK